MKRILFPFVVIVFGVLCSCTKDDNVVTVSAKSYLTLWNQCEAVTALQEYVEDVTNPSSKNFIRKEDRIATFDMDGTFVGELYPTYFEYNLLEERALEDATYKDIAPADVKEAAQEIREAEFDAYVKAYASKQANGFKGMTYGQSFYKPMLQVFDYLKANGFTFYVVSGSDRFICRALVESIGVEPNRVIGMDVKLRSSKQGTEEGVNYTIEKAEDLIRTDELIIKQGVADQSGDRQDTCSVVW